MVSHKHGEVVDMIRDCSHVTLTVIGKLGGHNGTKGAYNDIQLYVHVYMYICTSNNAVYSYIQSEKYCYSAKQFCDIVFFFECD